MARNRWMAPIADDPDYVAVLRAAELRHQRAATAFVYVGGNDVLSI